MEMIGKMRTVRYLTGRTEMAKFDSLMKATFNPPRNWTLLEDLKFYSDEITEEDAEMLRECGVEVRNSTKTKQYIITIPKGYVTDMASVPRACWAFIAPFDVARAAVVHDIMYEKINTQYNVVLNSAAAEAGPATKKEREAYREIADHTFLEGMNASVPPVASWKKYAAYYAVRAFGRWAINSSAKRVT
jgi:hypothetical protein